MVGVRREDFILVTWVVCLSGAFVDIQGKSLLAVGNSHLIKIGAVLLLRQRRIDGQLFSTRVSRRDKAPEDKERGLKKRRDVVMFIHRTPR